MQYTNNKLCFFWFFLTISLSYSQTNDLTSSPYSLFGLGVRSSATVGMNSGLGSTGIGRANPFSINNLNPASLASLIEKSMVLDLGGYVTQDYLYNGDDVNSKSVGNFSDVAIAFNPSGKLGIGVALTPSTDIGYTLSGLQGVIEGSNDLYTSNVHGSGGINKMSLSLGYQISKELSLGVEGSYLFGRVEEAQIIYIDGTETGDILYIDDLNYYRNFSLSLGALYSLSDQFLLGLTATLPTTLIGTQDRSVEKRVNLLTSSVEDIENRDIDDFGLPLEMGIGWSFQLSQKVAVFGDYRRNFWGSTNQSDSFGDFQDQNIYSIAAQYRPNNVLNGYFGRMVYNVGLTYDSGYLNVDGYSVNSYGLSAGLGLPLGRRGGSFIHLGYQFQKNGSTQGILVEENRNVFSININLQDFWFLKNYID